MAVEQTHRSKTSLPHGREVILITTPSQTVQQLQQHKEREDDLLSPVVNVWQQSSLHRCVCVWQANCCVLHARFSTHHKKLLPHLLTIPLEQWTHPVGKCP